MPFIYDVTFIYRNVLESREMCTTFNVVVRRGCRCHTHTIAYVYTIHTSAGFKCKWIEFPRAAVHLFFRPRSVTMLGLGGTAGKRVVSLRKEEKEEMQQRKPYYTVYKILVLLVTTRRRWSVWMGKVERGSRFKEIEIPAFLFFVLCAIDGHCIKTFRTCTKLQTGTWKWWWLVGNKYSTVENTRYRIMIQCHRFDARPSFKILLIVLLMESKDSAPDTRLVMAKRKVHTNIVLIIASTRCAYYNTCLPFFSRYYLMCMVLTTF